MWLIIFALFFLQSTKLPSLGNLLTYRMGMFFPSLSCYVFFWKQSGVSSRVVWNERVWIIKKFSSHKGTKAPTRVPALPTHYCAEASSSTLFFICSRFRLKCWRVWRDRRADVTAVTRAGRAASTEIQVSHRSLRTSWGSPISAENDQKTCVYHLRPMYFGVTPHLYNLVLSGYVVLASLGRICHWEMPGKWHSGRAKILARWEELPQTCVSPLLKVPAGSTPFRATCVAGCDSWKKR